MAKSKSKAKNATKRVDDEDEPQIEASEEELTEEIDPEEIQTKAKPKTKSSSKTKHVADDEESEYASDDDLPEELEDEPVQAKAKTKTKGKTKRVDDDDEPQMKDDEDAPQVKDDDEPQIKDDDDQQMKFDDEEVAEVDESADDESDAEDGEPGKDGEPVGPQAKISKLAIFLILLNWIAAPTFLFLAYVDNEARAQFAHRTILNYIQIFGLPLQGEEDQPSLSNETRQRLKLSASKLQEAYKKRTSKTATDFEPFEERFIISGNVIVDEVRVPFRIRPSDLTETKKLLGILPISNPMLSEVFQDHPDKPVATLEAEVERIKEVLAQDIKAAAKEVMDALAKKNDDEKRALVKEAGYTESWDTALKKKLEDDLAAMGRPELDAMMKRAIIKKVQFTFAWSVYQTEKLDKDLETAKGAELDSWLDDSLQRRMYYDLLAPINVFRPGDLGDPAKKLNMDDPAEKALAQQQFKVERLSDRETYPLEKVIEFMNERLDGAIADEFDPKIHIGEFWEKEKISKDGASSTTRTSIEKRQAIGFLMFALSEVKIPILDKKLYPKGLERAQIVSGLHECTSSMLRYVQSVHTLRERMQAAILEDRQGYVHPSKADPTKLTSTEGMIGNFDLEIDRLVKIKEYIDTAQTRLNDLKAEKAKLEETLLLRRQQRKDAIDKLLVARKKTEIDIQELRKKQVELHEALVQLSDAAERNFALEARIRAIETALTKSVATPKKGKTLP